MKSFSRAQQLVLLAISLAILAPSVPRRLEGSLALFSNSKTQPRQQWAIEVTGAVRRPGIYTFSHPPTTGQAVQKAGGILGNLPLSHMTRSNTLQSGTHIEATALSQMPVKLHLSGMDVTKRIVLGVPVDVNEAGLDELAIVPGINRSLAQRIIRSRESRNGFKTWHDLMGVRGVGPRNVKGFQDYLRLGEVSTSE